MNNNEQDNGLAAILAFFTGFIAGATMGLLYAPNSGAETREKVRKASTDVKNQTVEFVEQTIDAVKEGTQTLRTPQADDPNSEEETTEET